METGKRFILALSLLLSGLDIVAATLLVESLDDSLGSVATLRQTILNASLEDTIRFKVSGTILLDEALGELVVDKQLIIDGQNKIIVDGQNQINICFHITNTGTADASDSVIQNITIQNFNGHDVDPGSGTESVELPAYGILIDGGAVNCSVFNVTFNNINSGYEESAAGIRSDEDILDISGNIIDSISSEDNASGDSGNAYGVLLTNGMLLGNCANNTITNVVSGDTDALAGGVFGIALNQLVGDCVNNSIDGLSMGSGTSLILSHGIVIGASFVGTAGGSASSIIACNTVRNITVSGLSVGGILVVMGDGLTIQSNTIDSIENTSGPAHGLRLGLVGAVTNSLVSFNTISNITGSNDDGYGISIENIGSGPDSFGNDLLNNSIFLINGKAINIAGNGVAVDGTIILSSVRCADGCKLIVEGMVVPSIDVPQFKFQFFVSDDKDPVQAQTFIAERTVDVSDALSFKLRLTGLPDVVTFGKYLTATVTALPVGSQENNNTSEVSNALAVCEPTGNICQCAEVVVPEVPSCPVV